MTDRKRWLTVEETKSNLDSISSSYCGAKWTQVLFQLHLGKLHNCCLTPAQAMSLSAPFDSPQLIQEREDFLAGKKIKECGACWSAEAKGYLSDRISKSSDPSVIPLYQTPDRFKSIGVIPSYIEVSLSNRCQFSCAYCSPENSSSLYNEVKRFGVYQTTEDFGYISYLIQGDNYFLENEPNPYVDAFLDWFPKISKYVKVLRFTGGEPLLSHKLYDFLNLLIQNPSSDLELIFNSNLGIPTKVLDDFIGRIKSLPKGSFGQISFVTSVDGWGEGAKLARWGLDLELFERNFLKIREEFPEAKVVFTGTLNILALPDLKNFLVKLLDWKKTQVHADQIIFSPYPLHYPAFLSPAWCMDYFQDERAQTLKFLNDHFIGDDDQKIGFKTFEKDMLEKAFGKELADNSKKQLIDFTLFMLQHQHRKGWTNEMLSPKVLKLWEDGKSAVIKMYERKELDPVTALKVYQWLDVPDSIVKEMIVENLKGLTEKEVFQFVDVFCANLDSHDDEWIYWWLEQNYPHALAYIIVRLPEQRRQAFWASFVKRLMQRGDEYWMKISYCPDFVVLIPVKILVTLGMLCPKPPSSHQQLFWHLVSNCRSDFKF